MGLLLPLIVSGVKNNKMTYVNIQVTQPSSKYQKSRGGSGHPSESNKRPNKRAVAQEVEQVKVAPRMIASAPSVILCVWRGECGIC